MKCFLPWFVGMLLPTLLATMNVFADETGNWSKASDGVEARLTLVKKPSINGTRWLVPYLELRNVSDSGMLLKVNCDGKHVKFELVDAEDNLLRPGWGLSRSGPHADLGTIVLPHDSSIKISMTCRNWGIPKNAAAMVATDSGAWVLEQNEKGKVHLKVTLTGEEKPGADGIWNGRVSASVKLDWSDGEQAIDDPKNRQE